MYVQKKQHTGFALLLTLIVVSIVLAVGLSLLDITIKQLSLSGTGRDSEAAFHAASAGLECAQYWRGQADSEFRGGTGNAPLLDPCLPNQDPADGSGAYDEPTADVHHFEYEFTWGAENDRCTEIEVYVYDASSVSADLTYDIPNYDLPGSTDPETCVYTAGTVCTIAFSRGYNRACSNISSIGVIQREFVYKTGFD